MLRTLLRHTLLLVVAGLVGCAEPAQRPPMAGVSASLRPLMRELLEGYGGQMAVTYAGSSALRNQIQSGAPIDVAVLAGPQAADRLVAVGLAMPDSSAVLASNALVLIGPSGADELGFRGLSDLPIDARVAMGHPVSVPSGSYAREALKSLGTWENVAGRCVFASDPAAAIDLVRRGESVAGIVYATEARDADGIVVLERAEGEWAPRPVVVALPIAASTRTGAVSEFLRYLQSAEARAVFEKHGFGPP